MAVNIDITGHPQLEWLNVSTPGQYAMGLAVEVLEHLDNQTNVTVKNTGWKNGFGLEVCARIPITTNNCNAELMTDEDSFEIRKVSGTFKDFEVLYNIITKYLEG